jgi:hypothetical protein
VAPLDRRAPACDVAWVVHSRSPWYGLVAGTTWLFAREEQAGRTASGRR